MLLSIFILFDFYVICDAIFDCKDTLFLSIERKMTRGLTKCKETAEGSPKGHGVIVLEMSCLCVCVDVSVIWLIFSAIVLLAKKAQRTHEEVTKKAGFIKF